MIDDVTPLIITYNEADNLARVLDRLSWARRIVIVDSGSTDETLAIAGRYPTVEVVHRPFDDFANQCNFGLSKIGTNWALSLDADYELSDAFVGELQALNPEDATSGYKARFAYRIFGQSLRGTLYPARAVLYRRDRAYYQNEGHGHRVVLSGAVKTLANVIFHDDRKPLNRWIESQRRYARLEAAYLLASNSKSLSRSDRIRRAAWLAPIGVLFYTLILKRCILDGWAGWYYALQRLVAESLIALEIIDRRLRQRP